MSVSKITRTAAAATETADHRAVIARHEKVVWRSKRFVDLLNPVEL
jgi:hypothetical protein